MQQPQSDLVRDGFVIYRGMLDRSDVTMLRNEAFHVFKAQCKARGLSTIQELFETDLEAFVNCGKTCQHLMSLHRLGVSFQITNFLKELGMIEPSICTRPVLFFNSPSLAKSEGFYKTAAHQDWRSMQGSLNSIVVWLPLMDITPELGPLEVIPGSHLDGLHQTEQDDWFRRITDIDESKFVQVEMRAGDALFFSSFLVHRSGNITNPQDIRWSCHFRYNDLGDATFIERKYPNPYIYKPQQDLITDGFPEPEQIASALKRERDDRLRERIFWLVGNEMEN